MCVRFSNYGRSFHDPRPSLCLHSEMKPSIPTSNIEDKAYSTCCFLKGPVARLKPVWTNTKKKQWGWCPLFLSGRAFPSSTMYRGQVNATANFNTMNRSHDSSLTTKVRTPVCAFLLSLFFPRTQHGVCVQFSVLTRGATVNTPALPSSYGTHSHTSDHPNKQHEPNETGSKLWTRHPN